jgi:hypothetical protein
METLLPVKSDRCNLRKRRSERARKTLDRISKRRPGFGRRLSGRRSSASPLAHTGSPTLGASADRGCSSKFPAGMARSVYPRAFEGLVRAGPIEMLNLHTRTHQRAFLESWRAISLWQDSWLESCQHGRIFVRCPSSDQLSWRGKIPGLAGESIFYGPMAKRK